MSRRNVKRTENEMPKTSRGLSIRMGSRLSASEYGVGFLGTVVKSASGVRGKAPSV